MSSERQRGRDARDHIAREIRRQAEIAGRPVTADQARDRATRIARRADRELAANKRRKGD